MISIVGEEKMIAHWPGGSLKMFGTNPAGESIWRVVFSDSRTHMVGGKWPDGKTEYRYLELYPGIHGWVLEKWLSAKEYAGTREEYERVEKDPETGLLVDGPYPERGEFTHVFTFPSGDPPRSKVIEFIQAIEHSRGLSHQQRKQGYLDEIERKKREREQRVSDIFDNAWGPFGGNAVSGNPGKRTVDKVQLKYGAEDLAKPVGDGKFFQN